MRRVSVSFGFLELSEKHVFGFYVLPFEVTVMLGDRLPLSDGRLAVGSRFEWVGATPPITRLAESVRIDALLDVEGPADPLTVQRLLEERLTRRCSYNDCNLPTRYAITYIQPNVRWLERTPKVAVCLLHLEDMLPRPYRDWEVIEYPTERRFCEGRSLGRVVFDPIGRRLLTIEEHRRGEPGDGCVVVENNGKSVAYFDTRTGVLSVKQPYFDTIAVDTSSDTTDKNVFFDTEEGKRIYLLGITRVKQFLRD